MLLILSKWLISFFRYSNFCIYFFTSFFPCQPMLDKMIWQRGSGVETKSIDKMGMIFME